MMALHEVEIARRSAAMAPLSPDELDRLFTALTQLLKERAQIITLLERLPSSFGTVRDVLNRLQTIVN